MFKKKRLGLELSIEGQSLERKIIIIYFAISFLPFVVLFLILFLYVPEKVYSPQIAAICVLLIILCFTGYLFLKRIVHSILTLVMAVRNLMSGDLSYRINISSDDEIGELAKGFNALAEDLEATIEKLKASKGLLEEVLMKIGEGLAGSSTIDGFLELMVNTIAQALDARVARLWLVDEERQEIFVRFISGERKSEINNRRLPIGKGIEGWVALEKKAICLPRRPASRGSVFSSQDEEPTIVCVPLLFKDQLLGVLSVEDKYSKENFSDEDLLILTNIGAQTAVALENLRLNEDVEKTYMETLSALAMAVEAKDQYSRGHSKRVSEYAEKIARKLGLPEEQIAVVRDAADMHDIGKIGISDEILHKPGPLSPEEREIMNKHPVIGEGILKPVRSLRRLCDAVRHHHEWLDGTGYPDGLRGDEISIEARILCVADVFDALTSDRPYRKAMSVEDALAEIGRWAGKRYDEQVYKALCDIIEEEQRVTGRIIEEENSERGE